MVYDEFGADMAEELQPGAWKDGRCVAYNIKELAELAGVSSRTLRHYDAIDLLKPLRNQGNDYRVYGPREVDLLQQILLYREMGMPLMDIKRLVHSGGYDSDKALESHLGALRARKVQLERLMENVEKTIAARKGEREMSDREKFEGFKQQLVSDNENNYGREVREKFGDKTIDDSNAKLMGLNQQQYERSQELSGKINELLKAAVEEAASAGETARQLCEAHREWLMFFWKTYTNEAHLGLGQMYVEDSRFAKYYDDIVPGGAAFLRDALEIYCK